MADHSNLSAPAFTLVKWRFVGGSFILLLAGLSAALWRRRKGTAEWRDPT